MEQIRKTVVGVYHVFGQQAKIAVILDVNVTEEYFVCDMLNGVEKVLAAGKKVPFWNAPFKLTETEEMLIGIKPIPEAKPEKKAKAKPAAKKSAPKGKAKK